MALGVTASAFSVHLSDFGSSVDVNVKEIKPNLDRNVALQLCANDPGAVCECPAFHTFPIDRTACMYHPASEPFAAMICDSFCQCRPSTT